MVCKAMMGSPDRMRASRRGRAWCRPAVVQVAPCWCGRHGLPRSISTVGWARHLRAGGRVAWL